MIRKGTKVTWKWGSGTATGKVIDRFTKDVTRTIKGREITRKASGREPAYLIEQADGAQALKSGSEIERA